jgi:hypothetical protein
MLEAGREMLPLWADLLPQAPKDVVADAGQKIAVAMVAGD